MTRQQALVSALLLVGFIAGRELGPSRAIGGDQTSQRVRRPVVATIDVAAVFKGSSFFNSRMDAIRQGVAASNAELAARRDVIVALRARLLKLHPFDQKKEHDRLCERLQQMVEEVNHDASQDKQDTLRAETEVFKQTYDLLQKHILSYCRANGIQLLVKLNDRNEPTTREQVLQQVNSTILYAELDITEAIISCMNAKETAL